MNGFNLLPQIIRHRRAVRLVLGKQVVAEGFAAGVKDHGDGRFRVVLLQAPQHVGHALDRTGGLSRRGIQGRQGVVRPVHVGRTVNQNQGRPRHIDSRTALAAVRTQCAAPKPEPEKQRAVCK